ncbi:hypothetical protein TNCV_2866761 [Trichonephila clavipes]|nr:hypothetical protein TNCV_2866761 [Trichonephila clavipes]
MISIDGILLHIIRSGALTVYRYMNEILRPIVVPYGAAIEDDFMLMNEKCRLHYAHWAMGHDRATEKRMVGHICRHDICMDTIRMLSITELSKRVYTRAFGDGPRNFETWSWTTPELAPPSPNYHTKPTGGRFSSLQI